MDKIKLLVWLPVGNYEGYIETYAQHNRSYDILLNCYETGKDWRRLEPNYYFEDHDFKYRSVVNLFEKNFPALSPYDYFFFPDADIRTNPVDIERLVTIVHEYKLDLASPAMAGHVFWGINQPVQNSLLRYTNFVEPICPLFSRRGLFACLWTMKLNYSAHGFDFVWAQIMKLLGMEMGIVDDVIVEHVRPQQSHLWKYPDGTSSLEELKTIFKNFNLYPDGVPSDVNIVLKHLEPKVLKQVNVERL